MAKRIISLLLVIITIASLILSCLPQAFAASEMTLSAEGIEYLKNEEGFCSKPYWDYSQWTVGYGTKCPDDKLEEYKESGISKEDAEALMQVHITALEKAVNNFIDKNSLSLEQHQFDMLVCFSYNVGSAWLSNTNSGLRAAIINGDTSSNFVNELASWCKAGGNILDALVKRRMRDANMFLTGDYTTRTPTNVGYIYYAPNGGSISSKVHGFVASENIAPDRIPTYTGNEFLGWYNASSGGQKVETLTADLTGKTLYAYWQATETPEDTTTTPATPNTMEPINVTVTADGVNVRSSYGTDADRIGTVKKGEILTITEIKEASGHIWGKYTNGWISLEYTNYSDIISGNVQEPEVPQAPNDPDEPKTENKPEEETTTHTHKYEYEVVSPTCTEEGYTIYTCGCGDSYTENKKPILGHTWGDWKVLTEATKEAEGKKERVCSTCEIKESRTIEKIVDTQPLGDVIDKGTVKVSDFLIIRAGAGTNFEAEGKLKNGDRVEIYEIKTAQGDKWGRIKDGWICLKYVKLDSGNNNTSSNTTTTQTQKPTTQTNLAPEIKIATPFYAVVKVNDYLNVRYGPTENYLVLDSLENGDEVEVLETKYNNGMTWGRIGENRWINIAYVEQTDYPVAETTPEGNVPVEDENLILGNVEAETGNEEIQYADETEEDIEDTEETTEATEATEETIPVTEPEPEQEPEKLGWWTRFCQWVLKMLNKLIGN